jgi:hypothetical protein
MNGSTSNEGAGNHIPDVLKEMLKGGLSLMWRGFEYARDLDRERWEFAVDCDALCQAGLCPIDLRWLIARGYVELVPNGGQTGSQKQISEKNRPLEEKNASFVLTKKGAALALQILSRTLQAASHLHSENGMNGPDVEHFKHSLIEPGLGSHKPSWDRDKKELRYGGCVIKQFRWAAVNQETILMAFEEEDWPTRIDDPLPKKLNQDPKSRLHDTIKCLNRNHKKRRIRFNGDGTGEGLLWVFVTCTELDA